jgi:2'-5' RNA ligase
MLSSGSSRFFIALIPPADIQDYANRVVKDLGDRYRTRTAKAPPHVTLFPPFDWRQDSVSALERHLYDFAQGHPPIPVTLSGFGAFSPRVLYINVLKTPELLALQAQLLQHLSDTLNLVDPKSKTRPFSPHVTVASRRMTRSIFKAAWAELKPQTVQFDWVGDRLTLLNHDGDRWQIYSDFVLMDRP